MSDDERRKQAGEQATKDWGAKLAVALHTPAYRSWWDAGYDAGSAFADEENQIGYDHGVLDQETRVAQLEAALGKARLDGAKEAISGMRRLMVQRFGSYGAPKEAMFSYDSDAEYVLAEIAAVLGEPA